MSQVMKAFIRPFRSKRYVLFYLLLIGFGILGNKWALPINFGIHYAFGNLFLLVAAVIFGPFWGAAAAVVVITVCSATGDYSLLHFFYTLPELIVVGFFGYRKRKQIIIWALLYWLVMGIPTALLMYDLHFSRLGMETNIFIDVLLANALYNLLFADLFITYIPYEKWLGGEAPPLPYARMVYQIAMLAVIGPILLFMVMNSAFINQTVQQTVRNKLKQTTSRIDAGLSAWRIEDMNSLLLHNAIQIGHLRNLMKKASPKGSNMIMTDGGNRLLTRYEPRFTENGSTGWMGAEGKWYLLAGRLYVWLPNDHDEMFSLRQWTNAWYVYKDDVNPQLNLYVSVPAATYQQEAFKYYAYQYRTMMMFLLLAGIVAFLINLSLVRAISNLSKATTRLPEKLRLNQTIDWPNSRILEIASLILNFRMVSDNLLQMFSETYQINDKLQKRTFQLQKSQEQLHRLAYYDALTGMPNRLNFSSYLAETLIDAKEKGKRVALMFFDLNQFKKINDILGHAVGDEVLKLVAGKLDKLNAGNIQVFRLGGDEFTLVLKEANPSLIDQTANQVLAEFEPMVRLQEQEIYLTTSIGISIFPEDGEDMETLVKNADIAMYAAKEKGGNTMLQYEPSMNFIVSEEMSLETSLRKAMELNQFELYYQPKINNMDGTVTGMEALLRWKHPDRGEIAPSVFIPLAERTGLINPIGLWVLRTACAQTKRWQEQGFSDLHIAVNLSVRQLQDPDIVERIMTVLQETELSPASLQLEITEGFFIHDFDQVISIITQLHAAGVHISIDDFGTGYSSLDKLKHLPVHELKIDRSFIKEVHHDSANGAIVRSIMHLAHALQLNVTAEGIETEEEKQYLIRQHCHEMQGYLFSKPLPKEQFEDYLTARVPHS